MSVNHCMPLPLFGCNTYWSMTCISGGKGVTVCLISVLEREN